MGAVRQSRTRDRAISPETQRAAIRGYAREHGHKVAAITEDLSRSGSIPAFNRPGLGPYLTEADKLGTWDVLVTTKLDRACRNARDYLRLRDWCHEHGKSFVSLAEKLDDTTAAGRAMGTVVAAFAEFERDRDSERSIENKATAREQGKWLGGRPPFGWLPERREDGVYLVPDEDDTAPLLRGMVADCIAGKSYKQMAAETPGWDVTTVRYVMRSPNTLALLDEDTAAELRAATAARTQHRGSWTSGEHELLRVAYCAHDKSPLYGKKRNGHSDRYACRVCGRTYMKSWLERQVELELLARWGNRKHRKHRVLKGDDHSREIKRLESTLASVKGIELVDTSALEERIAELRAAPHELDREVYEETGQTIAEFWHSLKTPAQRNAWLRENHVTAFAGRKGGKALPPLLKSTMLSTWQ